MLSAIRVFFIIVVCGFTLFVCAEDIGEACFISEKNIGGICKLVDDCASAIEEIQNGKHPPICSFKKEIPIVCCPEEEESIITKIEDSNKRIIGKIADQKCWEYSESAFVQIPSPLQLFDREFINKSICTLIQSPLVVGGEDAKELEFPHMALLGFGDKKNIKWQCGGTLISDQFVLTAAHCLNSRNDGDVKFIRLGELDKSKSDDSEHEDFDIIKIIKHPNYLSPSKYDDIGILKMDRKVKFNKYIRPACLHLTKDISKKRYIATGWGINQTMSHIKTDHLQKVILNSYSNEQCNEKYKDQSKRALANGIVDDTQICAGGAADEKKDTCQGDSGGPLQIYHPKAHCMYSIIGITSFGKACGFEGEPGIYTRVSNYIEWIEDNVWL